MSIGSAAVSASTPVEMDAVGAGAHREIGMPVEQQRRALVLDGRRERLGVVDARALITLRQAQQHGGDIGRVERFRELIREPGRMLRGHEIEARSGAPRFGRFFSGRHEDIDCPRNRAVWGRL